MMTKADKIRLLLVGGCLVASMAVLYGGIRFGRDLGGALSLVVPTGVEARDGAVGVLRKRLDGMGVADPSVSPLGEDKVLVSIPRGYGRKLSSIERLCAESGVLSLHLVRRDSAARVGELWASNSVPDGYSIASVSSDTASERHYYTRIEDAGRGEKGSALSSFLAPAKTMMALKPAVVDGQHVFTPYFIDQQPELSGLAVERTWVAKESGGKWSVGLQLDRENKLAYREVTSRHSPHGSQNNDSETGRELAVLLDGQIVDVFTVPGTVYDGRIFIGGLATPNDARHLGSLCASGAFRKTGRIEKGMVSPDLGAGIAARILAAALIGGVVVLVLMAVGWRGYGLISGASATVGALVIPLGMIVAAGILEVIGGESGARSVFALPMITLWSIAGAGLALAAGVGMNVQAMQRISEEVRAGRAIEIAITNGYRRVQGTFVDVASVGLASGVLLFLTGPGQLKSFAVAMCAGFVAVFIATLVAGRAFVSIAASSRLRGNLGGSPADGGFDFMKLRVLASGLSLMIVLATWGVMIYGGFRGRRVAVVPDLWQTALAAIAVVVLGVTVVVMIRHSLRHAAGVVAAVLNTTLLTAGLFGLSGRVADGAAASAFMVVAGLAIYLTLAVFDRARELLKDPAYRRKGSAVVFNIAINMAMKQALLVCCSVLVIAVALMIACHDRALDFGLVLCIGVLCAVFSSVFIAIPVVLALSTRPAIAKERA